MADEARKRQNKIIHQDWLLRGRDSMRPVGDFAHLQGAELEAYRTEWQREAKESAEWQRVPHDSIEVRSAPCRGTAPGQVTDAVTRTSTRSATSLSSRVLYRSSTLPCRIR
jgi:hypothetical protein